MTQILVFGTGGNRAIDTVELHDRLEAARHRIAPPFSDDRLALVAGVSDRLLKGSPAAVPPHVTHFAFWTRRAALKRLEQSFRSRLPPETRARARGLAFHLPPQNVETVFLYSWVLSYLAGNANVIRLPREISPPMQRICDLFLDALAAAGEPSQYFLYYPSDSDLGARISAQSDARLVWGGNAKVDLFAKIPLRSGGKAIWFGDRFSFSVLKGSAIAALDAAGRRRLAERMANDIFTFDQMACSSPHVVYVVGDAATCRPALDALFSALAEVARAKGHLPETGHAIRKMVEAFGAAAVGEADALTWHDAALTSIIASRTAGRGPRVGGGFLRAMFLDDLQQIVGRIREDDQTVTHFGFEPAEIEAVVDAHHGFGVTRWTAVGSALDFDFIWDGYDIPFELTRLVRLR